MRWHLAFGIAAVLLGPGATLAQADDREDAANAMLSCAGIAGDTERLACFDAAAGRLKTAMTPPSREKLIADFGAPKTQAPPPPPLAPIAQTAPPAPASQAPAPSATQQQTAATEEEDGVSLFGMNLFGKAKTEGEFGQEQVKKPVGEEGLDSITAMITDFAFTPLGDAIVFLENGQVWRQTDGPKVKFPNNPQERRATINKALMGSYTLQVGDSNRVIRVRRVK